MMEVIPREPAAPETDSNVSRPWDGEPEPPTGDVHASVSVHEDGSIDEPGYGHGV